MERRRVRCAEDEGAAESRIPRLRRSASLRLRGERPAPGLLFPSISELAEHRAPCGQPSASATPSARPPTSSPQQLRTVDREDDLDSVQSYGSVFSTMSCDHAFVARNGTTFSGRRMKYVVHCPSHAGETEEYLTPTQRASKQIRRLKTRLRQVSADLDERNMEIFRLTKEVLELQLFKVTHMNKTKTDGEDAPDEGLSPTQEVDNAHEDIDKIHCSDLPSSLADSGHFEDMACLSIHSKDSPVYHSVLEGTEDREGERRRIVRMYEKRLEEMTRRHVEEQQELKEKHHDKVDGLLHRLSDSSDRYSDLRTEYDTAQNRIRDLEKEVESLRKNVAEQEERHQSMYLKMYVKGQEAAKFEHADQVLEFAHQAPTRVSVPELLQQLQVTENELENIKAMYRRIVETRAGQSKIDPEITLQFLKSAVYYFFTDRENQQRHMNAIQSILGYTDNEKQAIEKAYRLHK